MRTITPLATASTHQIYSLLLRAAGRSHDADPADGAGADRPAACIQRRDRGAVSLEQVLWFVAAGVAVAVIATILWGKIRTEAEKPINAPTAP